MSPFPRSFWVFDPPLIIIIIACFAVSSLAQEPQCPFVDRYPDSRVDPPWDGRAARNCHQCRWCPFRNSSCCEVLDENLLLNSIDVSGADHWNCYITLLAYQECGKCSPDSAKLMLHVDENSTIGLRRRLQLAPKRSNPDSTSGIVVRVCRRECQFIYKRCKSVTRLTTDGLLPWEKDCHATKGPLTISEQYVPGTCAKETISVDEFCDPGTIVPESSSNCWSPAVAPVLSALLAMAGLMVTVSIFL